ncbi:hypothetical protein OGATHE_001607 [Ogataea polymorpha]|uniref:Uncharacterized protein n=1 Tax=Ogataea polymorpha TaxID=460523 RepID=A0A9P8PPI8_9ASCO|nr:hypothetical protein OGATHE_001607 [Ogataea polymorpha]
MSLWVSHALLYSSIASSNFLCLYNALASALYLSASAFDSSTGSSAFGSGSLFLAGSAGFAGSASFISTSLSEDAWVGSGGAAPRSIPNMAAKTVISLWSVNISVLNPAGLVCNFLTFSTRDGSFISSAVFGLVLSFSIRPGSEKILRIPMVGSFWAIWASETA